MLQDESCVDVLVMGDILMDYQYWIHSLPQAGGDEAILAAARNSGGSAANTAVALCAQGVPCGFSGRIGEDELGEILTSQVRNIGLDLSCVYRHGDTGYTVTMIDGEGERTMFSCRGGEGYAPEVTDVLRKTIEKIKILYISGYMLLEEAQAGLVIESAALAQKAGAIVLFDTAPIISRVPQEVIDAFLAHVDVILPNQHELMMLSKCSDVDGGIEALLQTASCVVVKMGSKGARIVAKPGFRFPGGDVLREPLDVSVAAGKVTPVDTTGAGDSFNAGFISAFLRGGRAEEWLAAGNALAAEVIMRKGAVSTYQMA